MAKNKYLYRPSFLYLNSPFCGVKEKRNNLNVKFWKKMKRKRFKFLPALQEKSKEFKLATIKATFNLTLTQESNLVKLFSRNQTLVQLLTFSWLKINSKEKNKVQAFTSKCRSKLVFWWDIIQNYSLILAVPLKNSTFATTCSLKIYLLALQRKSKGFNLATVKAISNLTLTQESNLLGLFSKNRHLCLKLTH